MTGTVHTALDWSTFKTGLYLRVAVHAAILLALTALALGAGATADLGWVYALVLFDFALSGPYWWIGRRHVDRLPRLALVILLMQVLVVTVGEFLLGPDLAVYGLVLYPLLITAAAFLHSNAAAWLIAAASVGCQAIMASATILGVIPVYPGPFGSFGGSAQLGATALVNTTTSVSFAVVAAALATSLRGALARSRNLESELRTVNRNLETRVQDAVARVCEANVSLAARNEALERTLRHVNLFARAVSHDLRNPITAASESLRLGRSAEGASHDSLISLAMENLLRADKMLVGLRDLMRTIGSPETRERVDLEAVAREVLDDLAVVRRASPLPVQLGAGLGSAFARREELVLVYRNLIANAIDHNEGADGLVVEVGREARGGESFLYVRDNGKGIDPALHARIFEPFQRGEDSKEGLGLGLALVEAVVSHAGGRVFVESQPGTGATVFFTFPDAAESRTF